MTKFSSNSSRIQLRKTSKQLSYRFRHKAISSHDQVEARKWKKILIILLILAISNQNLRTSFLIAAAKYFSLILEDSEVYGEENSPPRKVVTVDSYSYSTCKIFFQFKKPEFHHLIELFKFPEFVRFKNRSKMSGEEVFLRGIHELVSGDNQERMCQTLFGRENTQQSRAFTWFIDHIYTNFKHLVTDSLPWWHRNGFTKSSACAIWDKMLSNGYHPTPEELAAIKRAGYFIDCKCSPTSVVGGGPADDGANAARWDVEVNRAFYNGWKSIHGLKHQTGMHRRISLICILVYTYKSHF